jgi:hypothetical protein
VRFVLAFERLERRFSKLFSSALTRVASSVLTRSQTMAMASVNGGGDSPQFLVIDGSTLEGVSPPTRYLIQSNMTKSINSYLSFRLEGEKTFRLKN